MDLAMGWIAASRATRTDDAYKKIINEKENEKH